MLNCAANMTDLSDETLAERAKHRDSLAFAELIRRAAPSSYRQAMQILRNREDSEDELQNSYLNAWRHIDQFRAQAIFSSWLMTIVRNQCFMRLRKLRQRSFVYLDDTDEEMGCRVSVALELGLSPEECCSREERSALVQREIQALPLRFREILHLCYLEGLSTPEAALRMSISLSAGKSRLLRARLEFENRLKFNRRPAFPLCHESPRCSPTGALHPEQTAVRLLR